MKDRSEILLGLSGGIDSEYSAKLLMDEGFTVYGLYINMLNKSTSAVEKVADNLGIDLNIINKSKEFEDLVASPFAEYYKRGKTPNPCVECNRYVKIQALLQESKKRNIPYIATGHYAKVSKIGERYCVSRAKDVKKDQSYFLWKLTQEQLGAIRFPLGDVIKDSILQDASVGYKESQDICFIDGDYREYLKNKSVISMAGNFLSVDGKIIGEHKGICNYTRGQRKGLGIALGYPAFVTRIDPESNSVVLGTREDLKVKCFCVKDLNFQSCVEFSDEREFTVKTRYRATPIRASVRIKNNRAYVQLCEYDTLVTPGQSAVFYDGDNVAFGGEIIEEGMK